MYSAPVFVYLASFIGGVERPTPVNLSAIALVMVGIVLLTGIYRAEAGAVTLLGIVSGLLSGLSYALFIFGFKYAGSYGPAPSVLVIAFATASLVLLPLIDHAQALTVPMSADVAWWVPVCRFTAISQASGTHRLPRLRSSPWWSPSPPLSLACSYLARH